MGIRPNEQEGPKSSDQGLGDVGLAEQDLSETEQTLVDNEQTLSDRDQTLSDRDQQASDEDQAASEWDSEHGGDKAAHARTTAVRAGTTRERDENSGLRDLTAKERDKSAEQRDQIAENRDAEAEALDAKESLSDRHTLRVQELRGRARTTRERAASDRARAARDRQQAAEDRRQAARDRTQAAYEREHAGTDELTGARRRGVGLEELENEIKRVRRERISLVAAYVDVDGLKAFNDEQGHAAGDRLLRTVVERMRDYMRPYDLLVRVGGDEFLCALPGISLAEAGFRLEAVRSTLTLDVGNSVTVGYAELEDGDSPDTFIHRADSDLLARRAG